MDEKKYKGPKKAFQLKLKKSQCIYEEGDPIEDYFFTGNNSLEKEPLQPITSLTIMSLKN